jgi:DDE domain
MMRLSGLRSYVRVKGSWKYLYRAVDKAGATVDFLLTAKRDRKAALRFLRKAIKWNGTPEKITIDKSGANTAALEGHNAETEAGIEIRQIKYLNNIVEQDHRAIKRLVRPMLGFKSFRSAAVTPAAIELMHMIRKASCGRQARCVRHGNSIRWRDKTRHIQGCPMPNPGNLRQSRISRRPTARSPTYPVELTDRRRAAVQAVRVAPFP